MNKFRKSTVFYIVLAAALAVFVTLWQLFFSEVSYYVPAAVLLIMAMLPLFFRYERKNSSARELTLTASLTALAVASRAVFYLVPQVKPIAAVVIIAGVCLGAERGYIVGALAAFVSNFIFGQGPWTPFQMAALGLVGLLSGLLLKKVKSRILLGIFGFLLVFLIYGPIADLSTVLVMYGRKLTLQGFVSVYAAGAPFTAVFAFTTAICLWLFGTPFIAKINRVITKYEILKEDSQ